MMMPTVNTPLTSPMKAAVPSGPWPPTVGTVALRMAARSSCVGEPENGGRRRR